MDLETLSNMFLDGYFDNLNHEDVSKEVYSTDITNTNDYLEHYGVLGMKWGIRRTPEQLGHRRKKKDRRYEGESDKEYQDRMAREHAERIAKIQAKDRARSEKRTLKSQERLAKLDAKTEVKTKKMQLEAEEKARKEREKQNKPQTDPNKKTESNREKGKNATPTSKMTDQEIRDAIARIKLEQEYLNLSKKKKGIFSATSKEVGDLAGGALKSVGKALLVKYLTQAAVKGIDSFTSKRNAKKGKDAVNDLLALPGMDVKGNRVGYKSEQTNKKKNK